MDIVRTQLDLLIERARPSVTLTPKSRTRKISTRRQLGPTRRSLYARLERRMRDRITPQAREVLRGRVSIRQCRQANLKSQFDKRAANNRDPNKPRALARTPLRGLVMRGMSR